MSRQANAHPEMSIDPAERVCWNCEFFLVRGDLQGERIGAGYCVRYPPRFKEEEALNDGFPYVTPQTWCGEFKSFANSGDETPPPSSEQSPKSPSQKAST